MRIGRDRRSGEPGSGAGQQVRGVDRDPIGGSHQGQRPCAPRQQAGHMTAPDRDRISAESPCAAGAVHTCPLVPGPSRDDQPAQRRLASDYSRLSQPSSCCVSKIWPKMERPCVRASNRRPPSMQRRRPHARASRGSWASSTVPSPHDQCDALVGCSRRVCTRLRELA